MRKIIDKAAQVAGKAAFFVALVVTVGVVLGVATTALAAAPGDPFRLGQLNAIDRISQLVGSTSASMLKIENKGAGSALQLLVEPGKAPLSVNDDAGKAKNLNADKLDGKDSGDFVSGFSTAEVAASASTSDSSSYRSLGGPNIRVTVPPSGFVEVGASAFISGQAGAVSLFDVTDPGNPVPVPGQSDSCDDISGAPEGVGLLFTSPGDGFDGTFSTPAVPNIVGFCANSGGPSTVLLGPLSPGKHRLQLRYAACDCGDAPSGRATFKDRRLWARPAP